MKIGGKRLSLPEMEAKLRAHEYVEEARLIPLELGAEWRIHAVVVPSASGWAALEEAGRRSMAAFFSRHLHDEWDRVLVPRAWRFVAELPHDEQGKTTFEALAALFDKRALDPETESESRSPQRISRRLRVPSDLAYLEGHFDSRPIVAGVVQLRWVIQTAEDWIGREVPIERIEALKFGEVLEPDQSFELEIEASESWDQLRFRLHDAGRTFSSGRCQLASSPASAPSSCSPEASR